jgi:hypothetical protein
MFSFISRLSNPAIFQGNFNRKNYFEGWYFKQVGPKGEKKLAVIPGVSLTDMDDHAFIQIFNGYSGKTSYIRYSLDDFFPEKEPFGVKIGKNYFNLSKMELEIPALDISGTIHFSDQTLYKSRWYEKGVMGWYGFVPFMETYHALLSLDHNLMGTITIENEDYVFDGGKGYIEKDWGESFPSSWIWMQSNGFGTSKASIMLSVAVIPWLGSSFIGHLAVMLHEGRVLNFSTYRGGKITFFNKEKERVSVIIETKTHQLEIEAISGKSVSLRSPKKGAMEGRTIESLSSIIDVKLISKPHNKMIFSGIGNHAGLEIMDEKNELIKGLDLE